jgi:uncharacterized protein (TIGR02246 family)
MSPQQQPSAEAAHEVLSSVNNATVNLRTRQFTGNHLKEAEIIVDKEFIRGLFDKWNNALATGDPQIVTQLYAPHATFLPTLSNKPRSDHESINNYFQTFLQKRPSGRIIQGFVQLGEDGTWAQDNGIYEFFMKLDGTVVRARYSFVYQVLKNDNHHREWKIVHHHSSLMPEK